MNPYPPLLLEYLNSSIAQVEREIERRFERSSSALIAWLRGLGSDNAVAYFVHPHAFPTFLLPWWLELSLSRGRIDSELQRELVYSSLNGYYCIRLIDDVMDDAGAGCRSLLPASAFFSAEFQRAYAQRFGVEDPFWEAFTGEWADCADATIASAALAEIDATIFRETCARKVRAARIPVHAVARAHGLGSPPKEWEQFFSALSEWHQMHNDWLDWQRDAKRGISTFFLSEARRRMHSTDSLESWMIREGFGWGYRHLQDGLAQLLMLGGALGAPVTEYLLYRRAQLCLLEADAAPGLAALSRLLESE